MAELSTYIIFKLADQSFGVEVNQVISIEHLQEITEIPRTSHFIKGITYIRDETTPILDLKERLLMKEIESTKDTRILVVHINNLQIGLIVDAASEVKDIDVAFINPAPSIIGGVDDTFVQGIAKLDEGLLTLLDLETIIDSSETKELREVVTK
ncbi:chemotaxis protein CheW [Oceanobacillus senegalensis]|uniref:chemotaxis protein CheW n=1 Tax=Oceanobacillus senegalensis TaxID=1936063 RepID=UPI000A310078|nr:chemotaxis protein CheW [Oceanobacillus senegalensis]